MSLKTRLRIAIVLLMAAVVIALSALYLHGFLEAAFGNAYERASLIGGEVKVSLQQELTDRQAHAHPPPVNLPAEIELWTKAVREDPAITTMLQRTLENSSVVVEIYIAGEDGRILAATNRAHLEMFSQALPIPSFEEWQKQNPLITLRDLFTTMKDYRLSIPLGVSERTQPIFTINILISSVLMRTTMAPYLNNLALVFLSSLFVSIVMALFLPNLVLDPLARISQKIDLIATDQFPIPVAPAGRETKEFADVQVKLNLLGQQFRGAKQNANELRSNVQQLLERLEEGVLLFDPTGRLMMAGKPVGRLLGRAPEAMIGQTVGELFPATSGLGGAILDALHTQQPVKDRLVTVEREPGGPARLVVSVVPVSQYASVKRAGTLVTLRDAESRRQLEMQLDVSGRLAAISRLTGGVAHEIKNPLNAIALHLEVLRTRLNGPQPEIEVIAREIARLDRVVRTFLDFNRPITLRMREMDFTALVREIAALVRLDAEKKNVRVELAAPSDPFHMRGDADLLKQAILNVVVNGIEAMKAGGTLWMRLERAGSELALAVRDEGPGIPMDLQEKIFNLYYSTKEKGSGIGLAITFRVVQLHNGTIDLISEPGKGATFFLRFPEALSANDSPGESQMMPAEPAQA